MLAKGDSLHAWRFIARALHSSTSADRDDALGVLLNLVRVEKSFSVPARALIEDMLVRLRMIESDEQGLWLLAYGNMEGAYVDPAAKNRSMLYAVDAQRAHALSREASSFCSKLLASADAKEQRASIPLLLVGAKLGGSTGKWSMKLCCEQSRKLHHGSSTTWQVLYETVTGVYLP